MKKNLINQRLLSHVVKISLLQMVLVLVLTSITMANSANGQGVLESKVTLVLNNVTLEEALSKLEKSAQVKFSYNSRALKVNQKVNINSKNEALSSLLNKLLDPLKVKYIQVSNRIVLRKYDEQNGEINSENISSLKTDNNEVADIVITGTVTDENGDKMPGVGIGVKGTTRGSRTDINGNFSISVPDNKAVLVFSFIGYQTQEIAVANQSTLNVSLKPTDKALDEIVVVGYGVSKKSDLTGSIVSLKEADLSQGTNSNAAQLLSGVAAGVNVSTTSSAPGAALKVQIRGAGSINSSNNVLFVVDGLPGVDPSALSPDDIESIEVLKDASASTIYGTRAANGVVLISTKKGQSGKSSIRYNTYYGMQNTAKQLDVLNAADYYRLVNLRQGTTVFSEQQIKDIGAGTNWQNEIFRTAPILNHQLSISNGNEQGNYYVGLNYFNQDGIVNTSGNKKINGRINAQTKPIKNLTITTNINFTRSNLNEILNSNAANESAGPLNSAIQYDPSISPILNSQNRYDLNPTIALDNPMALINGINNSTLSSQVYGTVAADYKFLKYFTATARVGGESVNSRNDIYRNRLTINGVANGGIGSIGSSDYTHQLSEYLLRFDKTFNEKHNVSILAGTTFEQFTQRGVGSSSAGFLSDVVGTDLLQSGNGELSDNVSSSKIRNQLHGILGRLNYSFNDKYLLTLSFRQDGSSRFAEGSKYAFFPAMSVGWNIGNEAFLSKVDWLSGLKIRAGYGKLGNQGINNFETIQTLIFGGNSIFGGKLSQGVVPARLPNPELRWETTSETNVGIDFSFAGNRFSGSVDYFNRITDDQLFIKPLPSVVGFTSVRTNIGSVVNRGIDFQFVSNNIQGRELKWKTLFNLSFLKNEVTKLPDFTQEIISGSIGTFINNYTIIRRGHALQSFYGYEIDGIFQTGEALKPIPSVTGYAAGMPKFVDQNGDGVITDADRVILGDPFPDYTFGITNQISYKKFALNLQINGVQGIQTLDANVTESLYPTNTVRNSISRYFNDRWTPQNPSNTLPSGVNSSVYGGSRAINSLTVVDASFVRLKNVTLGYDLPLGPKQKIKSLRIYGAAENLLTFTNYEGFDPDASATGNGVSKVNYNSYPLAKTFRLGLEVNF